MQPEALFQAARQRAETLTLPRAQEAREQLRARALALFAQIPEPPVYPRAEDPARKAAEALVPELEQTLALALAVRRDTGPAEATEQLLEALRAHGEALCHTEDGRLAQAEEAWRRAVELERAAHPTRSLGRGARASAQVYDRSTGASRYDPREEPVAQVWLACPNMGCKRVNEYGYVPGPGIHAYACSACRVPFRAYFGEMRSVELEQRGGSRRFLFTVDEIRGAGSSRIEFDEASGEDFPVARGDLLVFLYTEARELKAVMNQTNKRLMWISPASSCFVVTAAFGEGAPELVAFRAFRDEVLRHQAWGRAFIRVYYRHGPGLARWVVARPAVRRRVRWALTGVHRMVQVRMVQVRMVQTRVARTRGARTESRTDKGSRT